MPQEDPRFDAADPTAVLLQSLYGTQDAAANWEAEYASTLEQLGFTRGKSSPCVFRNDSLGVVMMVHGDEFFAVGERSSLDRVEAGLRAELGGRYESKVQRLGWTKGRSREARILARTSILDDDGLTIEADPGLLEDAAQTLGVAVAKPVMTPAIKRAQFGDTSHDELQRRRIEGEGCRDGRQDRTHSDDPTSEQADQSWKGGDHDENFDNGCGEKSILEDILLPGVDDEQEVLSEDERRRYVSVGALLNYVAPDRPEILFAIKECLRASCAPTVADMTR